MKMELKTDIEGQPYVEVSEAYNGFTIKTDAGDFAVCHRDAGIEIRLGDGPWYSWQGKAGPLCLSDLGLVPVSKDELWMITTFECEHGQHDSCDDHSPLTGPPERGGCCNSCWARRFAKNYLGNEPPPTPPPKKPEPDNDVDIDPRVPLGSLDRFRHG
jgi:hypothetical protein